METKEGIQKKRFKVLNEEEEEEESTSVVVEFASGSCQKNLPRLPPEIWCMILTLLGGNGKDVPTLLNCSRTCTMWRDLLSKEQTRNIVFFRALPFFKKYLGFKELLNCRRVCSQWKQSVDAQLERALARPSSIQWKPALQQETARRAIRCTTFRRVSQLPTFMRHMRNHTGNPFCCRTLRLDFYYIYRRRVNAARFSGNLFKVLSRFGDNLHSLILSCHPRSTIVLPAQIFGHLPHLKRLTVVMMEGEWSGDLVQKRLPWLSSLKKQQQQPRLLLPRITSLIITGGKHSQLVSEQLFQAFGESLESLDLEVDDESVLVSSEQQVLRPMMMMMSNLRFLKIRNAGWTVDVIQYLRGFHLPSLECLSLRSKHAYLHHHHQDQVSFPALTTFLNQFSGSMIQELCIPVRILHPPIDSSTLDYPHTGPHHHHLGVVCQRRLEFPSLKVLGVSYSLLGWPLLDAIVKNSPSLLLLHLYAVNITSVSTEALEVRTLVKRLFDLQPSLREVKLAAFDLEEYEIRILREDPTTMTCISRTKIGPPVYVTYGATTDSAVTVFCTHNNQVFFANNKWQGGGGGGLLARQGRNR